MRPEFKDVRWERIGPDLRLVYDTKDQLLIEDADIAVENLLELLREGGRTPAELAVALGVPVDDVLAAVELLDSHRLLEDADRLGRISPSDHERYFSNLAFFESFATLAGSREDMHERLRSSHVLVLGTGGLNSNTIPHLCGMGVGRFTLLDRDAVEARNFARQYLYRWADIGASKVDRAAEWVRQFDPTVDVTAVNAVIDGVDAVAALVDRVNPDIVMSGVDTPVDIDLWVNAACVAAGTPFVRGGMWVTQGSVVSVDPGRSACIACVALPEGLTSADPDYDQQLAALRLVRQRPRTNRGIGPVAGLLGALSAFEVLRYLTGFEPPVYAGRPVIVDFSAGCATEQVTWSRDAMCAVCASAPRALGSPVLNTEGR
jgi:molybdopterin/thiamine biosynthesis adenylyltransferase